MVGLAVKGGMGGAASSRREQDALKEVPSRSRTFSTLNTRMKEDSTNLSRQAAMEACCALTTIGTPIPGQATLTRSSSPKTAMQVDRWQGKCTDRSLRTPKRI